MEDMSWPSRLVQKSEASHEPTSKDFPTLIPSFHGCQCHLLANDALPRGIASSSWFTSTAYQTVAMVRQKGILDGGDILGISFNNGKTRRDGRR